MQVLQGGNSPERNCFGGDGSQRCTICTKDGAYAKIQMRLSAKCVSTRLHKQFHPVKWEKKIQDSVRVIYE